MSGKKILKGVGATWILSATRILNGLVVMPLYYHFVEAKLLGAWLLFVSLGSFLLLSDLGLALVLSRTLAWHKGLREGSGVKPQDLDARLLDSSPQDLYRSVSGAYWVLGLMVMFVGGGVGWFYLGSLDLDPVQLLSVRQAWLVYAAGVCFVLAGSAPNYALNGLGDVAVEASARAAGFVATMVLTAGVLWMGLGVVALAAVFLFQTIAVRAGLAMALRRRHPWLFETAGKFNGGLLKILGGHSLPIFVSQLGALFIFQINPVLIVSVLGTGALPDYNAMLLLAMYGGQVCMALPQTMMPFVAARKAAGDAEGIRRMMVLTLKASMALAIVYATVLVIWSAPLLNLWVGEGHYLGPLMMIALLVLYTLEFHHQAHSQFVLGVGKWPFAKVSLAAGVLNVVFVWVGLGRAGLLGAAAGTMAAQLVTNNWYVPMVAIKTTGLGLWRYLREVGLPLLAFALAMVTIVIGLAWGSGQLVRQLFGAQAVLSRDLRGISFISLGGMGLNFLMVAALGFWMVWKKLFNQQDRNTFLAALRRE